MSLTRCPVHATARFAAAPAGSACALSCARAASGAATSSATTPLISTRGARSAWERRLLAHATLQLFELTRRVGLVICASTRTREAVDLLAQRFILRCVAPSREIGLDFVHCGVHGGSASLTAGRNPTRGGAEFRHHLRDVAL